jgi:hypothetical protein
VATQRSEEVRIKALEAQIEALKRRKAQKLVRRDPALKQMHAAVRSIDKALAASTDHAVRQALGEARNTLTACLALTGAMAKGTLVPQARRSVGGISEDALLAHVRANPGHRSEQIAVALGTDPDGIRPVMKRLIKAGRVRTAGRARAMSYAVV